MSGRVAVTMMWAVASLLYCAPPARAQTPIDSPRVVLKTGARCHTETALQSPAAYVYHIGDTVHASQWKQVNGRRTWYFDSWRVMGVSPSCWIDGRETTPLDPAHPDIAYVVVADSLLARPDATFDDYVELLAGFEARPRYAADGKSLADRFPVIRYKSLQLIERAAGLANRWSAADAPLRRAWIVAHQNVLSYYEPDAAWNVPTARYWALLDGNEVASWAEGLAWTAAQKIPGSDECYADCFLSMIADAPQQYWMRFPAGAHIGAALRRADSLAVFALRNVTEEPPTKKLIATIRMSLAPVSAPEKAHLLDLLTQLDRVAKPNE